MSQPNNNNQTTTAAAAADNNNTASPVASLAATIPHVRSTSVGSHDSRSMSGSTTGGGGTTPGGSTGGGPGSIQTSGSGSLTGSPLPSPRDYPSAAAVTAAKSAAIVAATSGGGVLPPPWPETSTSSPPTATTSQQQQQHPPAIPILRNTSQNSAASTATPGLTQSISTEADTNTIISSGDKTLPSTTANTTSTATTSTTAKNNNNSGNNNIVPTASASVDSSVLLGLEELERQQYAHAEKKKAEQWKLEMTMKQQQQQQVQQQQVQQQQQPSRSLPPLAPSPASGPAKITPVQFSSSQQQQQIQQQRQIMLQQQYSNNPNQPPPPPPNQQQQQQQYQYNSQQQQLYYQNQQQHQQQQLPNNQQQQPPRASPPNVPSQIHLSSQYGYDTDDPSAALSSIENRSKEDTSTQTNSNSISSNMKRVTSIEKFQKSAQNTLRRFRSWSQDQSSGGNNNNNGGNGGGNGGGGGGGGLRFSSPPTIKSRGKSPPPPPNNEILGTPGLQPTPTKQHPSSSSRQQQQQQQPSGTVWDEDELTPLIYGYLHKLGRNGHWQKRFFETNGERLTYYKSGKRTKVLATLDLCKVGEIAIDKTDPEECTFTIQVSNRPYYLRAEDKARCNDWVIILNRAREARHGWGNIQLVNPTVDDVVGAGGRSQAGSDEFGPCIVISALRPRTKAVNYGNDDDAAAGLFPPDLLYSGGDGGGAAGGGSEEHEQIEVLDGRDPQQQLFMMQQQQQQLQLQMEDSEHLMMGQSQLQGGQQGDQPMAKWQKRHSALHHFSMRLLNWARSITSNADACRRQKDVVVVPAHVMRSMMSQAVAASASGEQSQGMMGPGDAETAAASVPPGSIHVTRPSVSGKPGLQDVVEVSRSEEMSQSNEASDSGRERKRTESSDSPAFGMGSSQYV